ncbi:hypothetical protein PM082_004128 [Marasmius tenuissimus]|nr:hypothetical protein PM082_004128 [Marasmius tenuissimus]
MEGDLTCNRVEEFRVMTEPTSSGRKTPQSLDMSSTVDGLDLVAQIPVSILLAVVELLTSRCIDIFIGHLSQLTAQVLKDRANSERVEALQESPIFNNEIVQAACNKDILQELIDDETEEDSTLGSPSAPYTGLHPLPEPLRPSASPFFLKDSDDEEYEKDGFVVGSSSLTPPPQRAGGPEEEQTLAQEVHDLYDDQGPPGNQLQLQRRNQLFTPTRNPRIRCRSESHSPSTHCSTIKRLRV